MVLVEVMIPIWFPSKNMAFESVRNFLDLHVVLPCLLWGTVDVKLVGVLEFQVIQSYIKRRLVIYSVVLISIVANYSEFCSMEPSSKPC